MCDTQNMLQDDASCEEAEDMNFATFVQQGGSSGQSMQQVVSMVGGGSSADGVQYMQAPQLISVPIALPGSKPGDPQPTVQIQVLSPGVLQQPPKYQMQIPIQGFQQGAVLTLAYSPDDAGSFQLIGNSLPEGVQLLMPQDMQMVQQAPPDNKEVMQQVYITPNQQIVINPPAEVKCAMNNNTSNNNHNPVDIVIKQECDVDENVHDVDESSQSTEASEDKAWQTNTSGHADLLKYLNTLQPQQAQALPVSLQQFLRMNPDKKNNVQVEIQQVSMDQDSKQTQQGEVEIVAQKVVKKKKYKKRPTKPARPKPGQVVIAQAADGTPIYCCPECQMAYPEKEQLEMHLTVHRIERRFICGICGAGLKRKEHLERHKLGHNPERPYVCSVCHKGFKRREHLNLHEVIHSGVKTELCGECGKGFYRKDHLRKHTRSHETRRLRDEPAHDTNTNNTNTVLPEITIHVPTSTNMQPVQIHIPQHVVNQLQQQQPSDAQATLDALLQQHST